MRVGASSVDETDQGFLARRRAARGAALFQGRIQGSPCGGLGEGQMTGGARSRRQTGDAFRVGQIA
jgi:hypothetical protein